MSSLDGNSPELSLDDQLGLISRFIAGRLVDAAIEKDESYSGTGLVEKRAAAPFVLKDGSAAYCVSRHTLNGDDPNNAYITVYGEGQAESQLRISADGTFDYLAIADNGDELFDHMDVPASEAVGDIDFIKTVENLAHLITEEAFRDQ